jgi:transposase
MLGPNAKAIITSLNGCFSNSKREVQQILKEIFHLPISLGVIAATAKRVNEKLTGLHQQLQQDIQASEYLHIDETGHKHKGKRGWAWIFTTNQHSLFKLSHSRGRQVLTDSLADYQGKVISDRYAVYNYFPEHKRQICWSHLARDYQRLAHSYQSSLASQGSRLVSIAYEVFAIQKALSNKQIEESYFLRRIHKLQKEISYIFKIILNIRGIPQAHRVIKRMQKSFAMMWHFVKDKSIAMTNNLAERQIRKYVIYRKKLLFTWSEWGNQYLERILSLYLTCRLQKTSAFDQLLHAINP